ncbi:MAG: bifunctional glutamate N-acetyltransferase/amino-acid acetyltransferase ArgJ [Gammaproteobacteria bacterium]|nr:bifunctional glutamate N-acetyltransferase/amino-acid acetyltransferase ArgJ [Gammaproteobacteria bacterium]
MAVRLAPPCGLLPVPGIRTATASAGLRRKGGDDVALITLGAHARSAAMFTRNRFRAAPVQLAREHLERAQPRALLINSGCANAGTGKAGYDDARRLCAATAQALGVGADEVLPFSTGVIGERLPVEAIKRAARNCVDRLSADAWLTAADAIMTTDTVPKGASRRISLGGTDVTVTGIAKGSGMIEPDMATMLAFIATDAPLADDPLRACLETSVNGSFNRITVDGDTSTNDACVLMATGEATLDTLQDITDERSQRLCATIAEVMTELAQAIVRDAEGATKFVAVEVSGGATERDCLEVAYTVARSPLVKTALFASDPNWGRILAAVGRARVEHLDVFRVALSINEVLVLKHGEPVLDYTEEAGAQAMGGADITIHIDLGLGSHQATVWTSDLSYDYVRINAEYRT